MCCEAEWKREVVPDHKFDFINVPEFHRSDFLTRLKYIWKYILVLKNFAVYGLDIFTAVTMISSNHWYNTVQNKCGDDCAVTISFSIAKWVFVGCIIFSFLLLGYETYKARKVIRSRDISYAFTNLMANDYYSLRSYNYFCLFCHINNSTKRSDDFAFFVYFTFKDWKRLLLADGPRQSINALILYSFVSANGFETSDIPAYWDNSAITAMLLFSMIATVLIFAGSLVLLIIAAVLYVPLLCYIQGNLKEYVCHKVDKRISELIKRKQRDRIRQNAALEKKLAQGGIKNAKGEIIQGSVPQPTLPNVVLDEDEYTGRKMWKGDEQTKSEEDSTYHGALSNESYDVYADVYDAYGQYPPQLDFNQQYQHGGLGHAADEYGSSTHLALAAAPLGISYPPVAPPQTAVYPSGPNNGYSAQYQSSIAPSRSQRELPFPSSRSQYDQSFPQSRSQNDLSHGYPNANAYRRNSGGLDPHTSPSSYPQPRPQHPARRPSSGGLAYEEEQAPTYTEPPRGLPGYSRDLTSGGWEYRAR